MKQMSPLMFSDVHSKQNDQYVFEQLKNYNSEIIKRGLEPVSLYFKDESDKIIAGLTGRTQWGALNVEILWVHEKYRGQKLGAKLLDKASDIAHIRNCENMVVETMDFQARDFYLKQGFKVFGVVENTEPKFNCYYMKKILNNS